MGLHTLRSNPPPGPLEPCLAIPTPSERSNRCSVGSCGDFYPSNLARLREDTTFTFAISSVLEGEVFRFRVLWQEWRGFKLTPSTLCLLFYTEKFLATSRAIYTLLSKISASNEILWFIYPRRWIHKRHLIWDSVRIELIISRIPDIHSELSRASPFSLLALCWWCTTMPRYWCISLVTEISESEIRLGSTLNRRCPEVSEGRDNTERRLLKLTLISPDVAHIIAPQLSLPLNACNPCIQSPKPPTLSFQVLRRCMKQVLWKQNKICFQFKFIFPSCICAYWCKLPIQSHHSPSMDEKPWSCRVGYS